MTPQQIENLIPGTLVKVKNDGKQYAGHGAKFLGTSDKGNAGLQIKGRLVWMNPDRIEVLHGK